MCGRRLSRRLRGMRSFRLLLVSLAVSSCGDWLYNVALLALVYQRTGSPTLAALTTAARVLPLLVLGPLAGALADRHDRRRLLIASDLTRAGLMGALALVAAAGLPVGLAPLLAALATAAGTVTPPAIAASVARVVPTRSSSGPTGCAPRSARARSSSARRSARSCSRRRGRRRRSWPTR